jgi:hypothetical protein
MPASYANTEILYRGRFTQIYTEITLDSSYAANGESITADQLGLRTIKAIWPSHAEGYIVEPVKSTDSTWLLKVWVSSTPSTNSATAAPQQSSTGRDLSAVTIPLLVVGG